MPGSKPPRANNSRQLRVIGGCWRSRKVSFDDNEAIRPSPDRIRETLFNWLQSALPDARCLELYAGSGILSIEALSRGAAFVTCIDQNPETISQIKHNLNTLEANVSQYQCIHTKALAWLEKQAAQTCRDVWDIIFLDPPFNSNALAQVVPNIIANQLLSKNGLIYIESAEPVDAAILPATLEIFRRKKAGKVHYCLCRLIAA